MESKAANPKLMDDQPVKWYGYLALILGILFFCGIFKSAFGGALKVLDFNTLLGSFGKLGTLAEGSGTLAANFKGTGGVGVKDGFLMALTVMPTVMFALAIVSIIEHYDGLRAAQRLLTPLLRPLMGIPGIAGLALISSLQSADAGSGMTNDLLEKGLITEKERNIFTTFQFTAGGTITNFFLIGGVFFAIMEEAGVGLGLPLLVIVIGKLAAANFIRLIDGKSNKKVEVQN
ncbi:MAG: nucleoside recognition domain-containing protein [Candidatus Pelethousia sp.]|nr:nucleoside recognition domain-containing protein [Candidatus Pelethousia sp.]